MRRIIFLLLVFASVHVLTQSLPVRSGKFEISFHIGYSNPLLEARGDNLNIDSAGTIHINGKRVIDSDNLATNVGYTVQASLKYNFFKKGYVKGLFLFGYNVLYGVYDEFKGVQPGIRIQTFSAGLGTEVNPIGHEKTVYPSIFGLFKLNLIGGESYYNAGLDFLKVTSRFGYTAGLNLNFNIKKNIGIYTGYSYSFDNAMNREAADTYEPDPFGHAIPFRDEASPNNGLSGDRRIAYWSLYLGMNFFF